MEFDLITVSFHPSDRTWCVRARADVDQDWDHFEGSEGELDELLSLARDVATGG
jgi:hypothetical protein